MFEFKPGENPNEQVESGWVREQKALAADWESWKWEETEPRKYKGVVDKDWFNERKDWEGEWVGGVLQLQDKKTKGGTWSGSHRQGTEPGLKNEVHSPSLTFHHQETQTVRPPPNYLELLIAHYFKQKFNYFNPSLIALPIISIQSSITVYFTSLFTFLQFIIHSSLSQSLFTPFTYLLLYFYFIFNLIPKFSI